MFIYTYVLYIRIHNYTCVSIIYAYNILPYFSLYFLVMLNNVSDMGATGAPKIELSSKVVKFAG